MVKYVGTNMEKCEEQVVLRTAALRVCRGQCRGPHRLPMPLAKSQKRGQSGPPNVGAEDMADR